MVSSLQPRDLLKQAFKRMSFHGQNEPEKDPKLRQRNSWCFFSPS